MRYTRNLSPMYRFVRGKLMISSVIFVMLFFTLFTGGLSADDAWVEAGGGSVSMREGSNSNIQMVAESIRIDLYDEYFLTDASFVFYNYGQTTDLQVGFPEFFSGTQEPNHLRSFKTFVNDIPVPFTIIQGKDRGNVEIQRWYVKEVHFLSRSMTVSRVMYEAPMAQYGQYRSAEYLYGTGRVWRDAIGKLVIHIRDHSDHWIERIEFMTAENNRVDYLVENTNENTVTVFVSNLEPSATDKFRVLFSHLPKYDTSPMRLSEKSWKYDKVLLEQLELRFLSLPQLRILRNCIFAWHGYSFQSEDMQLYFGKEVWYEPDPTFSEELLTELERQNVELLLKEEERRMNFMQ